MSGTVNRVILLGYVGDDPQGRVGNGPIRFRMATNKSWRDKAGERQQKATWVTVVSFNQRIIDVVERYVKKRSRVYVEGELVLNEWTTDSGQKRSTLEVLIDFNGTLTLMDKRDNSQRPPTNGDAESYGSRSGRADANGQYDMSQDEEADHGAHAGRQGSRSNYERPLGPPPGYDPNKRPRTTMDEPDTRFDQRDLDDEIPF